MKQGVLCCGLCANWGRCLRLSHAPAAFPRGSASHEAPCSVARSLGVAARGCACPRRRPRVRLRLPLPLHPGRLVGLLAPLRAQGPVTPDPWGMEGSGGEQGRRRGAVSGNGAAAERGGRLERRRGLPHHPAGGGLPLGLLLPPPHPRVCGSRHAGHGGCRKGGRLPAFPCRQLATDEEPSVRSPPALPLPSLTTAGILVLYDDAYQPAPAGGGRPPPSFGAEVWEGIPHGQFTLEHRNGVSRPSRWRLDHALLPFGACPPLCF